MAGKPDQRTPAKRDADRAAIARRVIGAHETLASVAADLGVHETTAGRDLAYLRSVYRREAADDTVRGVGEDLARLGAVESAAWERFPESADRDGWRYLEVLVKTAESRRKLLGRDAPTRSDTALHGPGGGPIETREQIVSYDYNAAIAPILAPSAAVAAATAGPDGDSDQPEGAA